MGCTFYRIDHGYLPIIDVCHRSPKNCSLTSFIALIDQNVRYVPHTVTGFTGESVEALSVHAFCAELNQDIGVHLMIYDFDDVRGALKMDAQGRPPRGDARAARRLLSQESV